MRLALFREKLEYEINQAQDIIDDSSYPDQRVQVHIYCIAALLRKIMMRVSTAEKMPVRVRENWEPRDVPLLFLVNRIIHYFEFLPSVPTAPNLNRLDLVRILSDEDSKVSRRELSLEAFLNAARHVVEDDIMVLNDLVKRSKRHIGRLIYSKHSGELRDTETVETLIDLFDAVRNNPSLDAIGGQIPAFYVQRDGRDMMKVMGVETQEVEIRLLCEKLFVGWQPIPFRQFQYNEYQIADFELRGRMLDLESHEPEFPRTFMIRADDLLSVLAAIESQLRGNAQAEG